MMPYLPVEAPIIEGKVSRRIIPSPKFWTQKRGPIPEKVYPTPTWVSNLGRERPLLG